LLTVLSGTEEFSAQDIGNCLYGAQCSFERRLAFQGCIVPGDIHDHKNPRQLCEKFMREGVYNYFIVR